MSEPKTITAVVELSPHDIACDWSDDDAVEFVKELDEAMASWPFSLAMYEYFSAQKAAYDAEVATEATALPPEETTSRATCPEHGNRCGGPSCCCADKHGEGP